MNPLRACWPLSYPVLAVLVRHVGRSCTPWATACGRSPNRRPGWLFNTPRAVPPSPSAWRGHTTSRASRPQPAAALASQPHGLLVRDVVWYRKADGDGGTVRALLIFSALVFDFPPHPLIPARPARTPLILTFVRVPQQQRPTTQRSRAKRWPRRPGRPPEGGGQIKSRASRLRGMGLCCRLKTQRGSEGSRVLRTAFRKPTTPRGAAPVAFVWLGRRQVAGAAPRGAVSKLQAVRRTHENPRRGGLPPTPTPAPSHNGQRPVQQRPTLRTTTANTRYDNGQHTVRQRPTRAERVSPPGVLAGLVRRVGCCGRVG
ncbi:hypothetical protein HNR67_002309 [Crossiella cryophila]|uniref:Uncharacterized protein n=1 Tax=Crossiella cryophila TaxID=43355 RepID=A0A7W7FRN5_9PSEU|nr:hypothetical protein [Crossiella cryophila]